MTTRSVWCEYAWLGGSRPTASVLLAIADGRITAVTEESAPPPGVERRVGLTMPGFANAHSHAFHRALRGRTHDAAGDFWTWRDRMYRLAARLDPDGYFRLARATYSEMVLAGYTTVAEFHYLHHGPAGRPYDDPNAFGEAIVAAARDAGIRLTLLDTCYLHGGIDRQLDVVQRRFGDGDVDGWMARVDAITETDGMKLGAAIHSVRACRPEEIEAIARWAGDRPLHAHVSEQPRENEDAMRRWGLTPTAILEKSGALGPAFTAVHATHLTDGDRASLSESASTVCVCPTTERDLADGVGDMRALLDRGSALSLGSDSNAVIDPFAEATGLEMSHRLDTMRRGCFTTAELLSALTNHASLGWDDVGSLTVGSRADLVTIDLGSVRTAGSDPSTLLESIVHGATAADVRTVTIDGVDRVDDARYLAGDVAAEFAALLPRLSR